MSSPPQYSLVTTPGSPPVLRAPGLADIRLANLPPFISGVGFDPEQLRLAINRFVAKSPTYRGALQEPAIVAEGTKISVVRATEYASLRPMFDSRGRHIPSNEYARYFQGVAAEFVSPAQDSTGRFIPTSETNEIHGIFRYEAYLRPGRTINYDLLASRIPHEIVKYPLLGQHGWDYPAMRGVVPTLEQVRASAFTQFDARVDIDIGKSIGAPPETIATRLDEAGRER